jgi:hypothetical protein
MLDLLHWNTVHPPDGCEYIYIYKSFYMHLNVFICLYIQSQEAMLDLLHWNTTLRMDVNTAAKRTEETDRVHSQVLI